MKFIEEKMDLDENNLTDAYFEYYYIFKIKRRRLDYLYKKGKSSNDELVKKYEDELERVRQLIIKLGGTEENIQKIRYSFSDKWIDISELIY